MNTTNYIRIFRGDDSDALGYQTIVGTIKTDLDLAGCKAVFRFLGFYAEFDPIPEDKKLTIAIPAQASRGFPPGVGYASLKVFDSLGKIRTFTNRIPVIVDTMTPSCGCGEFEVSFSPFPELEPLKIFIGPNADDFDQYTGFLSKIIDRASLAKYGLVVLADAMSEDGGASGKAASPHAVKAAYDAIIKELTDNYYDAAQTDEAIDRVAAYYITYDAAGNPFPTYASLANATTVYSGGKVRVPTRNDYCVVLADETHDNAEYRYIYAVAEGQTTGSWQPQFPVEGVMTVDQAVQKDSSNPVSGGGIWSALWGTASTAFSSLYDWCVSQLAGKATKADATLTERGPDKDGFSAWTIFREGVDVTAQVAGMPHWIENIGWLVETVVVPGDLSSADVVDAGQDALYLRWIGVYSDTGTDLLYTATRTALSGYQLGSQTDKPLASEAEADALRTGKANRAANPTAGNLAALDASGNPTDSLIPAANVAVKGNIPYDLGTPTVINSSSVQTDNTDPNNPISWAGVTLADRTANVVQINVAIDELRVLLPGATCDKVRDLGLVIIVGDGTAELAAPAIVVFGEAAGPVELMNHDGAVPELADGTTTTQGITVLYFSELKSATFLVKGEQVQAITQ